MEKKESSVSTNHGNSLTHDVRRSAIWRADNASGAAIGQEPVASFIAAEVTRDPDIRIALEGPWGSGKTRVLSLVQTELMNTEDRNVVVAWYDPWKYSPDETVLRRTLLDAIGCAVDEQCSGCQGKVTRDRFHTELERVEPKSVSQREADIKQANKAFWTILKGRSRFYLSFAAIWTLAFGAANYVQHLAPILGHSLSIFVAAAGAALLAALVQDAVQAIQVVEVSPNVRTTLPKLDQIDQFEAEYRSVMTCLATERKNLVVLVDDLDRCNEKEIQTVMSALATYLESPHNNETGRVSFVVAMDENKVVRSMRDESAPGEGRQNIIQKHFHLVVPVPIPTDAALHKVLESTLAELKWEVSLIARRRMTNLTAAFAGSNLRMLRSATTEAHTMMRYYTDVLEPQGIKLSEQLIQDPVLCFRVALIRETTPSDALRRFLNDPRVWLGKAEWPNDVPKALFDMTPRFGRNHLDPRPLLGLAPGMLLAAIAPAMEPTIQALKANNPQEQQERLNDLLDGYQGEALISLVSMIIAGGLPVSPAPAVGLLISGLVSILFRARDSLDQQDFSTFTLLREHLQQHVPHDQFANPGYPNWIEVAISIGSDALTELFQPNWTLMDGSHRSEMLKLLLTAAEGGRVDARLAYQVHARLLGSENFENLIPIALTLVRAGKLGSCTEIHHLQVTAMEKWNYAQRPDGPPLTLYAKDLVMCMNDDLQERAAKAYQIAANQQQEKTREFVAALPREWPTRASGASNAG